jgi:hypothetical protein
VTNHGLLAALMEPEASVEDEFNDWYDHEHLPHMCAIPGVLTGVRFIAVAGWPRYVALYDLEELATLRSDAYRAVTGTGFSPWSRRVLSRVRGWRRLSFEQRTPGTANLHAGCGAIDMHLFTDAGAADAVAAGLASSPGVLQRRVFSPGSDGPAALLVEAGSVASLPRFEIDAAAVTWSARLVRYSRTDPFSAFHRLETDSSP